MGHDTLPSAIVQTLESNATCILNCVYKEKTIRLSRGLSEDIKLLVKRLSLKVNEVESLKKSRPNENAGTVTGCLIDSSPPADSPSVGSPSCGSPVVGSPSVAAKAVSPSFASKPVALGEVTMADIEFVDRERGVIWSSKQNGDMTVETVITKSTHMTLNGQTYKLVMNPRHPSIIKLDQKIFVDYPCVLFLSPMELLDSLIIDWYSCPLECLPRLSKKPTKKKSAAGPKTSELPFTLNGEVGHDFDFSACQLRASHNGTGYSALLHTFKEEDRGQGVIVKVACAACPELYGMCVSSIETFHPARCLWDEIRMEPYNLQTRPDLRVFSWNLLAPIYAGSEYAQSTMFPYCPPNALAMSYRKPLTAAKILQANADLYFFQECTEDVFTEFLCPLMNAQGLECKLGKKKSRADEGVAICFRRSKFVCEETELRVFRESLMNEPEHEALRQDLRRRWGRVLDVVITKMPAVVLLQCLRRTDDSDRAVIVANSHFYWHPKCGHIRALQAYIMMCNLAKFSAEMRRRYDHVDVVIAGDFNADAGTGAIDLFTKGRIPSDHPTWAFAPIFGLGNYETAPSNPEIPPEQSTPLAETSQGSAAAPERALETAQPLLEVPDAAMTPQEISPLGPELTVPSNVKLQSALAEVEKTYKFTNHIGVFKAILDWIFISPNLKVEQSLCGVSLEAIRHESGITAEGSEEHPPGLPTLAFPSDHIPLLVDLSWSSL